MYRHKYHCFSHRKLFSSRTAQLQYSLIEFPMALFSPILASLAILSKAVATPLGALDLRLSDGSNAGPEVNFISNGIGSGYATPVDLSTSQANIYNGYPDQTDSTDGSFQDIDLDGAFAVMTNDPRAPSKYNTPIHLSASQPTQKNNLPAPDILYQPVSDAHIASHGGSCKDTTSSVLFIRGFQPCCDPIDDEPRNAYCCPGGHVEYAQVRIGCVSCMLFHGFYSHLPITSAHGDFYTLIETTDAVSKPRGPGSRIVQESREYRLLYLVGGEFSCPLHFSSPALCPSSQITSYD